MLVKNIRLLIVLLLICSSSYSQVTYQTVNNGNWSAGATWLGGVVPPNPLLLGDTIIISHLINYDVTQAVTGVMIVDSLAVLSGGNDLFIGLGGVNEGVLLNNGTIVVDNLTCEPDDCLMPYAPVDPLPVINNYGILTATNQIDIGQECGSGSLYNYPGGNVITQDMEINGYVFNQDSMYITNELEIEGGTIDGCGYVETPQIVMEQNGPLNLPGVSNCQAYCSSVPDVPPVIEIGGTVVTIPDVYTNPFPAEGLIDTLSVFCFSTLPVELLSFNAQILTRNRVDLDWLTATELNNDYFTIERSLYGENWEHVGYIDGAGTAQQINSYTMIDNSPYEGVSYYRLIQTDFDGRRRLYKIRSVDNSKLGKGLSVHPNPATIHIYIQGEKEDLKSITISSVLGQDLTSVVLISSINERKVMLDISSLPKGIYYVRGEESIIKFIKQ